MLFVKGFPKTDFSLFAVFFEIVRKSTIQELKFCWTEPKRIMKAWAAIPVPMSELFSRLDPAEEN